MENSLLLRRYRRDRRKLLEFILTSGGAGTATPQFADADLDTVSVDHVLDRVKSGEAVDVVAATERFFEEIELPAVIHRSSGNLYFCISKPESSGPPPQRAVPPPVVPSNHSPPLKIPTQHFVGAEVEGEIGTRILAASGASSKGMKDAIRVSLGLPSLRTGLSDDDLRETAYEVLIACVKTSSGQIHLTQEKKHEKKLRFLTSLRSRRDGQSSRHPEDSHSDLLDLIRAQMEISEALDACTKKGLRNFPSGLTREHSDVPQISLTLLGSICKSDISSERLYTQWKKRQVNVLEELLTSASNDVDGHPTLSIIFSNLRYTEDLALNHEILTATRRLASGFSSMLGKFGLTNETYYWTSSYHFNIRLYEKLLFSVFDILEDGHLIEEEEEFLLAVKATWPVLGIVWRMHNALYGWVFFQQFIRTGEPLLLQRTICQMQKVLSCNRIVDNEDAYMSSLTCSVEVCGSERSLRLVDAIFINVYMWCSSQLKDYHLHFSQEKSVSFESVLNLAVLCGTCFSEDWKEIKYVGLVAGITAASKLVHLFVEKSTQAAYKRVVNLLGAKSAKSGKHPLSLLAVELKSIYERDLIEFSPILSRQYPEAGMLSSLLLHQLFREHLEPFLDGISDLAEPVGSVLAESNSLECCLVRTLHSVSGENWQSTLQIYLRPYQISHICGPLILLWINAQHCTMFDCTKRAIHIEDWEPMSSQRRHGASIVEIFRIIEEAIDQFFNLKLPMDTIHLRSLLIGIVRSLEAYLQDMINHQVDKHILYPRRPPLTRYKKSMIPTMKKKFVEHIVLEEKVISQLHHLTASKLCVKLNTLHYIRNQLDLLEESIKQSWMFDRPVKCRNIGDPEETLSSTSEPVEEMFTLFDDIKRSTFNISEIIFDFIGTRVIFWDMRDSFIYKLYRGNVECARLEISVPQLDAVLNHICDLIVDTLRDQVVSSICQASMDGYVWVLLDGGPLRVFSEYDTLMMQEDLNILKDLFVANGEGLPTDVVEKEAAVAQQIIKTYSLKPDSIIEMLMSATQQISIQQNRKKPANRSGKDVDTLLRILCHNKDEHASKFLKMQYQLPKSSDYEDSPAKEAASESTFSGDLLNKSTSFNWSEKGQRSFRGVMKKFQEATSEIRQTPW